MWLGRLNMGREVIRGILQTVISLYVEIAFVTLLTQFLQEIDKTFVEIIIMTIIVLLTSITLLIVI